jgi:hypothetical protein
MFGICGENGIKGKGNIWKIINDKNVDIFKDYSLNVVKNDKKKVKIIKNDKNVDYIINEERMKNENEKGKGFVKVNIGVKEGVVRV